MPGLAWRDGGALRTSGRAAPVDLDGFAPGAPALGRAGPIEITRGCVWACRFCQTPFLFRARFRHRSLEVIREAIRAQRAVRPVDVRFITPSALSWGSEGDGVRPRGGRGAPRRRPRGGRASGARFSGPLRHLPLRAPPGARLAPRPRPRSQVLRQPDGDRGRAVGLGPAPRRDGARPRRRGGRPRGRPRARGRVPPERGLRLRAPGRDGGGPGPDAGPDRVARPGGRAGPCPRLRSAAGHPLGIRILGARSTARRGRSSPGSTRAAVRTESGCAT